MDKINKSTISNAPQIPDLKKLNVETRPISSSSRKSKIKRFSLAHTSIKSDLSSNGKDTRPDTSQFTMSRPQTVSRPQTKVDNRNAKHRKLDS